MRRLLALLSVAAAAVGVAVLPVIREPRAPDRAPLIVDDVSQLNPIRVSAIIQPTSPGEIARAVAQHAGPVSIGGGRHSMGGQIATEDALFIDMRRFNKILEVDPRARTVRVQAGATWRELQEAIDPFNLSIKVMQSFGNYTIGGSLSVNAHGTYVGGGPLITTVRSITVVLADGSIVEASPNRNPEIFYGTIGGNCGPGVVGVGTLGFIDNLPGTPEARVIPLVLDAAVFLVGTLGP